MLRKCVSKTGIVLVLLLVITGFSTAHKIHTHNASYTGCLTSTQVDRVNNITQSINSTQVTNQTLFDLLEPGCETDTELNISITNVETRTDAAENNISTLTATDDLLRNNIETVNMSFTAFKDGWDYDLASVNETANVERLRNDLNSLEDLEENRWEKIQKNEDEFLTEREVNSTLTEFKDNTSAMVTDRLNAVRTEIQEMNDRITFLGLNPNILLLALILFVISGYGVHTLGGIRQVRQRVPWLQVKENSQRRTIEEKVTEGPAHKQAQHFRNLKKHVLDQTEEKEVREKLLQRINHGKLISTDHIDEELELIREGGLDVVDDNAGIKDDEPV